MAELLEFGFSAVEVRADLFADEATDEAFEICGGFVVGAAIAVAGGFADGAEGFEGAQALASGAFGDAEFLNEVVEGEGFVGNKQ